MRMVGLWGEERLFSLCDAESIKKRCWWFDECTMSWETDTTSLLILDVGGMII